MHLRGSWQDLNTGELTRPHQTYNLLRIHPLRQQLWVNFTTNDLAAGVCERSPEPAKDRVFMTLDVDFYQLTLDTPANPVET